MLIDWSGAAKQGVLTLIKLRTESNGGPGIELSLTVRRDISWRVHYCGLDISPRSCPLLATLPPFLSSVAHVVKFLSVLSTSHPCVGNSDQRFLELMSVKSGELKDAQGTAYVCSCNSRYNIHFCYINRAHCGYSGVSSSQVSHHKAQNV